MRHAQQYPAIARWCRDATATLLAGEYYRVDLDSLPATPGSATYLRATKPVYASHIGGFGCEMGQNLLPPVDRGGSREAVVVCSDNHPIHVLVVVPASAVNDVSVSGGAASINAAAFVSVPGTAGNWMAARIQYDSSELPPDTPIRFSNSTSRLLLATLAGNSANFARYSYQTDFLAAARLRRRYA